MITLARLLVAFILAAAPALAAPGSGPVEFDFVPPANASAQNPYSRELWATVTSPRGQKLTIPAYYADGGLYAVRVRPDEVGTYHLDGISETTLGVNRTDLVVSAATPRDIESTARVRLPAVLIDPANPRRFVRSDGLPFVPVGANLAWAADDSAGTAAYYEGALATFAHANLNWMRVWMAHWDGLNLDWLPHSMGPSPAPGILSEDVARSWDRIVEAAQDNGVYLQVVLQHHGQYTTANDSNWAANPWNAANPGGFLRTPEAFFTDANARILTLVKYRYIIARWGWSPAILSWELFNEVHWTDAFRHGREADVARWHGAVADHIRLVDVYGHLITTSTENLRSPIYAKMDYYQPHLYAANMVAGARSFAAPYASLDHPAFYGEEGDDHEAVPAEAKRAGLNIVPPIWASVMGEGSYAAEPWNGWQILQQGLQGEVGAVFRFLVLNRVSSQTGLMPFSAVVEGGGRAPVRIVAGQYWQRRPAPDFDYPVDGAEPLDAANVPAILVGTAAGRAEGFPDQATYHLDMPRAATLRLRVDAVAKAGGGLQVSVDGNIVATHDWAGGTAAPDPPVLEFPFPAGAHALNLRSLGPDWVGVASIDLGVDAPALALIGRRNDRFIEAWVWNRTNLYAVQPSPPLSGTINFEAVPAGSWKVTWWDTRKGAPTTSTLLAHPGGSLRLPTPPILRHAAVVLTRLP